MTIPLTSIFTKGLLFFAAIAGAFIVTKLIGRYLPKVESEDENELPK